MLAKLASAAEKKREASAQFSRDKELVAAKLRVREEREAAMKAERAAKKEAAKKAQLEKLERLKQDAAARRVAAAARQLRARRRRRAAVVVQSHTRAYLCASPTGLWPAKTWPGGEVAKVLECFASGSFRTPF